MPADYLACRDSYVKKGVSMKTAKARCAAWFYKKHGYTVNEAHKKGEAMAESPLPPELIGEDLSDVDWDLVELMLKDLSAIDELANSKTTESTEPAKNTTEAKSEIIAINKEFLDDFNVVEIVATKVGAKAYTEDGRAVVWTAKALEKAQGTWKLGRASMNHENNNHGRILASFMDGELLRMVVKVSDSLKTWIQKAGDLIGVSIEAMNVKINKAFEIMSAIGTGVTFVFPPHEPACTQQDGCGIVATQDLNEIDGAQLSYEERQKLPDSAFCGPNRSFPAHDAAHVRNGLARLPQSGLSTSEKASTLACLKSRAKKYGISTAEEVQDEVYSFVPPQAGTLPDEGRKILKKVYDSCRAGQKGSETPEDKAKCAKIAWTAVHNAGFNEDDTGKWAKSEVTETVTNDRLSITTTSSIPDEWITLPFIKTEWKTWTATSSNNTIPGDAPININEKDKILETPEKGELMAEEKKEEPKTICAEKHERLMKEKDDAMAALNVEIASLKATVTKFEDEKRSRLLESLKSEGVDSEPYKTETIPVIEKVIAAVQAFKKKEENKPEVNSGAVVTATAETKTEPQGNAMAATADKALEEAKIAAEAEKKRLEDIKEKAKKFGY